MTTPDPAARAPRPPVSWTDLGPRIASSVVLITVIATALYLGGYVFAIATGIVFGLIYREWEQMVTLKPLAPFGMVLMACVALSAAAFPMFGWLGTAAFMALAALVSVVAGDRSVALWRIAGFAFLGFVIVGILSMRGTDGLGIVAGWFLGLVIALNDTGAYFTGRIIGGEKLVPAISPAKTWSGAIGGWIIGTTAGTIYWAIFTQSPWWIGLVLAGVTGLLGQVGDLSESAIKRRFRVKDSGDIIPGHGGLMDRLDSTSFGVLFLFLVGTLHGGGSVAAGFLNW